MIHYPHSCARCHRGDSALQFNLYRPKEDQSQGEYLAFGCKCGEQVPDHEYIRHDPCDEILGSIPREYAISLAKDTLVRKWNTRQERIRWIQSLERAFSDIPVITEDDKS